MSRIEGWWARLRPWLRRRTMEREIDDEFAFHLEKEIEQLRAGGLSDAEARRAAQMRFGGAVRYREEVRESWTGRIGRLASDVRQGFRRTRRRPGLAVAAILTLALGIGANAAIFSLVRSTLFRPLPYANPEALVVFWDPAGDLADNTRTSLRELVEYRRVLNNFSDLASYTEATVNLAETEPERVTAAVVTGNLFATLGAAPLLGRVIGPDDAEPGRPRVAVLGHGVWQRQFGGRLDIVGAAVRMGGQPRTVIGVMPPSFRLPFDYRDGKPTEVFVPNPIDTTRELAWGDRSYFIIGRLARGTTLAQAEAEVNATHTRWTKEFAELADDDLEGSRVPIPVHSLLFRDVGRSLTLIFAAVGVLLLVACGNVAHLLLASGDARRRELATQAVLGATRGRLATQLLAENLTLAAFGAAAGVGIGYLLLTAALRWAPVNAIRMAGVSLDVGVLLFTAAVAVAATMLAGIVPALSLSRASLGDALAGARATGAVVRPGPRRLLVVGEMALSLMLVLSAALIARSYAELRSTDLGFDPDRVVTLRIDLPAEYRAEGRAIQFYRNAVTRFADVPGVEAAGAVRILPLSGTIGDWSITLEHRPTLPGENPNGDWQIVTPGYFETMRMRMRSGRAIEPRDTEDAPLVAVVSETMAARYWPAMNAIGQRFKLGTGATPWVEIVGIAEDIRHNTVVETPRAEMYIPHAQWPRATDVATSRLGMTLVARTSGDPDTTLARLRDEIRAIDPYLPVSDARTMNDVAADALAAPRFATLLLGAFAVLALVLAAIGLYGVVSFVTASRTREIGVRIALGARPASVCRLLLRDNLAVAAAGIALGLLASVWSSRFLAGQLHGVSRFDPVTFATAPAVLLVVAVVASYLPARRATIRRPVDALRLE